MLYTWNQYNIVCQLNLNKKKKEKQMECKDADAEGGLLELEPVNVRTAVALHYVCVIGSLVLF